MNKKKNLLILLLTIPASSLLIAAEDAITATTNNEGATDIFESMPRQKEISFNNNPQDTDVLLEQRFICEQEGQEGGVVCQMYECLNEDCHAATAIKTEDAKIRFLGKELTVEEMPSFDFDDSDFNESEILCPVVGEQKNLTPEEEETTELTMEKNTPSEAASSEAAPSKTIPSETDIMSDIDVPSRDNARIQQLKREIRDKERKCERAESDPREKAICEDASADVQWRKQKIKALENQ